MAENRRLGGENIKPTYKHQALKLVGKRVQYLRGCDIDKSGRGHFFPRCGVIVGYLNRQIEFDGGDFVRVTDICEMKLLD